MGDQLNKRGFGRKRNKDDQFSESFKALDNVCQLLACSKCGIIEREKVMILGSCFHKYCPKCGESMVGKPCVVCKVVGKSEMVEDGFSTSMIKALLDLKDTMNRRFRPQSVQEPIERAVEETNGEEPVQKVLEAINGETSNKEPEACNKDEDEGVMEEGKGVMEDESKENKKGTPVDVIATVVEHQDQDELIAKDNECTEPKEGKSAKKKGKKSSLGKRKSEPGTEPLPSGPQSTRRSLRNHKSDTTLEQGSSKLDIDNKKKKSRGHSLDIVSTPPPKRSEGNAAGKIAAESTPNLPAKRGRKSEKVHVETEVTPDSPAISLASVSFSSAGSNVDKKNAKGETRLHVACRRGQLEEIKQLILSGANPDVQDFAGWTPLHEAINGKTSPSCKLEMVKQLCEMASCNPNIPGMDNETALHEASRGNLQEVVAYLLEHGASPNVRNLAGKLPREVAAGKGIDALFTAKSAGHVVQGVDEAEEDPVVLAVKMSKAVLFFAYDLPRDILKQVTQKLQLNVTASLGGDVTHIIFPRGIIGAERKVAFSPVYLHGIVIGAFMLSSEWIEESLVASKVLSPTTFEIKGCYEWECEDAPRLSRLNKEHVNPGLLHGFCVYFYKSTRWNEMQKKDLIGIVELAGGHVINREPNPSAVDPLEYPTRFHAKNDNHKLVFTSHIILYDEKNKLPSSKLLNMEHMKTLNVRWLIDSLGTFSLKDPEPYL